jgi:hypothetical protein
MRTILIAHHDQTFAEQLTAELRAGGHRVIDCAGPWPPELRCIRCDRGYCPLTESADLMIYDPDLTGLDQLGEPYNLAVDSLADGLQVFFNEEPDIVLLDVTRTCRCSC